MLLAIIGAYILIFEVMFYYWGLELVLYYRSLYFSRETKFHSCNLITLTLLKDCQDP